jgi:hypothetical protein
MGAESLPPNALLFSELLAAGWIIQECLQGNREEFRIDTIQQLLM